MPCASFSSIQRQAVVAGAVHRVLEVEVGLPGGVHGLVDLGPGDVSATNASLAGGGVLLSLHRDDLVQPPLELALLVVRQEGRRGTRRRASASSSTLSWSACG
jgi:hypothetical protein